ALLSACGTESAGQEAERWQRQGQLLAWDREGWIVDAVPIVVPASLGADAERERGARVVASGVHDERGRMVATSVALSDGALPDATLAAVTHEGVIASVDPAAWIVDDVTVVLPEGVSLVVAGAEDSAPASLAVPGTAVTVHGFHFGARTVI